MGFKRRKASLSENSLNRVDRSWTVINLAASISALLSWPLWNLAAVCSGQECSAAM